MKRNLWLSYSPLVEYLNTSKVRHSMMFNIRLLAIRDFSDLKWDEQLLCNPCNVCCYVLSHGEIKQPQELPQ